MADYNTNQNAKDGDSDGEDNGLIDTEPDFPVEYRKPWTLSRALLRRSGIQLQVEDRWMLETFEKDGALRLAQSCLSRERRVNSSRGSSPTTWESKTARAMFY